MVQMFTAKVLVLRATRFSFNDEKSKEEVKGCKFTYVGGMEPAEDKQNSKGLEVMQGSFPIESYDSFINLPAYFNLTYELSVGAKGKAALRPVKCEFLEAFKLGK